MKKTILFLLLALPLWAAEPVVDNVSFQQFPDGNGNVAVFFDATDADGDTLRVWMEASTNGGLTWDLPCDSLQGDAGEGITPGVGKFILWQLAAEHPGVFHDNLVLRVLADDGVGPTAPAGFATLPTGSFAMGA
ncbi:MAG: hypothetical protein QGG80_06175, partial [Candidatus Krumholzibacteria bacterium]|nr:hypothetical protein [Candidatus Krumholzibacteria bacterium]